MFVTATLHCDVEKVITDLREKANKACEERTKKFNEWKAQWQKNHEDYKKCYNEIVEKRHAWHVECVRQQYLRW